MRRIRLSLSLVAVISVLLRSLPAGQAAKPIPWPEPYELERMIGNKVETSVRVAAWKAPEPQRTNLLIYSVLPPQMDEALMRRVAERFGIKGEIEQIRGDTLGHLGFWIKETNPTNSAKSREVKFWLTIGSFSFSSGDDGYLWDIKQHQPLMHGVPNKEEGKQKALELLPLLGLSTNDLEHYSNGRLRWASGASEIGYTDRVDKQRKKAVMARNVSFYQRVPGGGVTAGVGDGGELRFSFVREGKVSRIEWFFRKMEKAGEAQPKTSKDIMRDLRNRNAWTWHQGVPTSLTVTNCVLAYPQGNSWLNQDYVWPFYMVTGTNIEGHTTTFYVPLEWDN